MLCLRKCTMYVHSQSQRTVLTSIGNLLFIHRNRECQGFPKKYTEFIGRTQSGCPTPLQAGLSLSLVPRWASVRVSYLRQTGKPILFTNTVDDQMLTKPGFFALMTA